MKKPMLFVAFLILMGSVALTSFADEIILKNGEVIQCNILEKNNETGTVTVDVVLDGQLAGMQMSFKSSEIKTIKKDGKYKNLTKKELDASEKLQAVQKHLDRLNEQAAGVDQRINERVAREVQHLDQVEATVEERRQLQKLLEHEKEMERLKAEEQRRLLKESKEIGVNPNVHIIDSKHDRY